MTRIGNLNRWDLAVVLPAAALVGAGLAAIQSGPFWIGWAGFSALLAISLLGLCSAWRWAGGGRTLAWMTGLALALRLAAGVAVYVVLPIDGHDEPDDRAGFVFTDAHRRDDQAWELASSGKPLWSGFNRSYYTDQYGGLLVLSAAVYKVFSPDAHRPLLVLALAALSAALGVPFLLRATSLLWEERLALLSTWIFVLYPESLLTGGAQMREPFLLTFIAVAYWGFANWLHEGERKSLWCMAIGITGMLLVSPGIAVLALVLFGGWLWLRGGRARLSWPIIAVLGSALVLGVLILAWGLSRRTDVGDGSVATIILDWMRGSFGWVIYELERGSGMVQNVFSKLNPAVQFLFVVGYGITQPVLPPAFFAPTTLTWHVIAILRALGWYLLLPLLLYAPIAAWRAGPSSERRTWTWLAAFCWSWIIVCAIRAGGDQWDNPRYRLIFFGFQSLVASHAWLSWKQNRDAWLPRIMLVEILCLAVFSQWYLARYYLIGIHLPILVVMSLGITSSLLVMAGGWAWDRRRARSGPVDKVGDDRA